MNDDKLQPVNKGRLEMLRAEREQSQAARSPQEKNRRKAQIAARRATSPELVPVRSSR